MLEVNDAPDMRDFARLFPDQFRAREELVSPLYRSKTTNYRDRISVGERLAVTLRFLATVESFKTLCYQFRMGASTIRQFVPETCAAVYQVLEDTYMKCPDSEEEWQQVADGFRVGGTSRTASVLWIPPGTGSTRHKDEHTHSPSS